MIDLDFASKLTIIIAAGIGVLFLLAAILVGSAVEGFEDETGFHLGKPEKK